jgi:hypothetical protein
VAVVVGVDVALGVVWPAWSLSISVWRPSSSELVDARAWPVMGIHTGSQAATTRGRGEWWWLGNKK